MGKFQSQRAMNSIRHDDDIRNSMRNRGECPKSNHTTHVICGCGADGCVFETDLGKWIPAKEQPEPPMKKIKHG